MSEPLLSVRGLFAGYGRSEVLHGVDLDVMEGEAVGLVGPNGAGKSTFLKVLSGIIGAQAGTVRFGTKTISEQGADCIVRAGVVQVPEGRQVFPGLSVSENLWLGGYTCRDDGYSSRLAQVFELFPKLKERLKQPADTLSGGEQQMLAIGRGLMAGPRLLMLDEPTLGLAPVIVDTLIDALQAIQRFGVTLLVVEQNAFLAEQLCERVYVMTNGRIARQSKRGEISGDDLIKSYVSSI